MSLRMVNNTQRNGRETRPIAAHSRINPAKQIHHKGTSDTLLSHRIKEIEPQLRQAGASPYQQQQRQRQNDPSAYQQQMQRRRQDPSFNALNRGY